MPLMDATFLDLLVHPVSKKELSYDDKNNCLTDGTDTFPVKNQVPLLLPPSSAGDQEAAFNYQEHYEKDALVFDYFADWHPVHKEENRRLHQQILRTIPRDAGLILDVGCGGAWLAKALIPKGKKVISMDISTTNPMRAVQQVASPLHWGLVADVYSLPLKERSVDCIIASEIIEHVKDPQLFLAALYKALKPGGSLIVTTPFNETIGQSLCIHCNQLTPHNAHIHSFTAEKIKSIAPQQALTRTRTFNSKVLVNLQLHLLLKKLPFALWAVVDKTVNGMMGKRAMRLMLIAKK